MIKFILNRTVPSDSGKQTHVYHHFPEGSARYELRLNWEIEQWLAESGISDWYITQTDAAHGKCFLVFENDSDAARFKLAWNFRN